MFRVTPLIIDASFNYPYQLIKVISIPNSKLGISDTILAN
jgi:hypothetical protein